VTSLRKQPQQQPGQQEQRWEELLFCGQSTKVDFDRNYEIIGGKLRCGERLDDIHQPTDIHGRPQVLRSFSARQDSKTLWYLAMGVYHHDMVLNSESTRRPYEQDYRRVGWHWQWRDQDFVTGGANCNRGYNLPFVLTSFCLILICHNVRVTYIFFLFRRGDIPPCHLGYATEHWPCSKQWLIQASSNKVKPIRCPVIIHTD